jgi:hypothetical protein
MIKPGHIPAMDTAGMTSNPVQNQASPVGPRTSSPIGRALMVAAMLLVAALLLAACGGGTSKTAAASPPTTPAGPGGAGTGGATAAQLQAFRTCLAQHGVTLPTFTPRTTVPGQTTPSTSAGSRTPTGRGGGGGGLNAVFSNPADQNAVNACQNTLPAGYVAQQQARQNQRAAFNSCMADHGMPVPATAPGSPPSTLDQTSAAYKACSPLLPTGGPNGASASSTTTPAA